jgi:ubiquinone biosynthesis protein
MSPKNPSRSIQIATAFIRFGWAWLRLRNRAPEQLPDHLRQTLEGLGTTFIKLGQGLSLRRDLLPDPYREALDGLQSNVPPFASEQAINTIESAFGQPIRNLFSEFEPVPFAAASVAQVHKARMPDGRVVAVKVRRPAIAETIKADLRLLRRFARIAQLFLPALRRQRPLELIDELSAFLLDEIDFSHEARNMRRVADAFDGLPVVTMPHVIEPLATQAVLVQEFSHGRPLAAIYGSPRAREVVDIILTAYIHQFFGTGVFHADPHPGNLFDLADGRVCFHDFGSIGYLDPASRTALAQMIESIGYDDTAGVLDAAVAMGFIGGVIDRREYQRAISEILSDLAALPLSEWSVAEAIWRVAKIGAGEHFRLPRHLLVLMRTLFLVENTLRALDPQLDLLGELTSRREEIANALEQPGHGGSQRPVAERLARTAQQIPVLVADMLRQAREEGRPSLAVYHRGLDEVEVTLSRTGNRLSLALVTLGLYLTGSILMLHAAGPMLWGHIPLLAGIAYGFALLLSIRLVFAISRSGHL